MDRSAVVTIDSASAPPMETWGPGVDQLKNLASLVRLAATVSIVKRANAILLLTQISLIEH